MGAYTVGKIRIETIIPIKMIQSLYIESQENTHVNLALEAFIFEDDVENALFHINENAGLSVWVEEILLYTGIIVSIQITQEGNEYRVSLRASSATVKMDCEKKSRTFQNIHDTYRNVIRGMLKNTEGAKIYFHIEDGEIGAPLYQIEETDWEFIKRIASHLNTTVVSNGLASTPEMYIGNPRGTVYSMGEIEAAIESVWIDKETGGVCRRIKTYENMTVGDQVSWGGILYTVTEKRCFLEKGLLCFNYKIVEKEAFSCKKYENSNAVGRLFSAQVIGTKEEQVKVKFDIDESQKLADAYWYPWRPDVGNFMYCMPEKGEKVYIHLGNYSEEQAWAVCGIHENGKDNPEMKVSDRYFTTADRKRLFLLPDKMGFQDLERTNPLEMSLADDSGINLTSNKKLSVSAKDTIEFKGNNVFFQAPKEVSLVRKDSVFPSVINMCNGFDSIGVTNEVTMTGVDNICFPASPECVQEGKTEYSTIGIERSLIASTPCKDLKNNMERQIRGVMVDSLKE